MQTENMEDKLAHVRTSDDTILQCRMVYLLQTLLAQLSHIQISHWPFSETSTQYPSVHHPNNKFHFDNAFQPNMFIPTLRTTRKTNPNVRKKRFCDPILAYMESTI